MASFTLLIENPQNSEYALNYATAVLGAGHKIRMVFFYKQGIFSALNAKGIFDKNWLELAQKHKLVLSLCSASSAKAGLSEIIEANPHCELVGLTTFVIATQNSDRNMQF